VFVKVRGQERRTKKWGGAGLYTSGNAKQLNGAFRTRLLRLCMPSFCPRNDPVTNGPSHLLWYLASNQRLGV